MIAAATRPRPDVGQDLDVRKIASGLLDLGFDDVEHVEHVVDRFAAAGELDEPAGRGERGWR